MQRFSGRGSGRLMPLVLVAVLVMLCAGDAAAKSTSLRAFDGGLEVSLQLPAPGPFHAQLFADPPRLAIDLGSEIAPETLGRNFRSRLLDDGSVRLEVILPGPMEIARSTMAVGQEVPSARLDVRLRRVASADFAAPPRAQPAAADLPIAGKASGRLTIALDPGHGGHDPGASHGAAHESELMLIFAKELKADLLRSTPFDVVLTRKTDRFVPLEARQAYAKMAGADLFVSLHADGLEQGSASGATVFTHGLTQGPTQDADQVGPDAQGRPGPRQHPGLAAALRDDGMLAATGTPSDVALAAPYRSQDLARALVRAIDTADLPLYKHPRQEADFVVLRSREMPSVLVELGFLSEEADRARIMDAAWRARMAAALRRGMLRWAKEDASFAAVTLR